MAGLVGCVASDDLADPSTGQDRGELDLASCICASPSAGDDQSCDACRTEQVFRLVKEQSVTNVAIAAENVIAVGEKAHVEAPNVPTVISNAGGHTLIDTAARVLADVRSIGPVYVDDRAFVRGGIETEGWARVRHRATVNGPVHSHTSLRPTVPLKWSVSFPRRRGDNVIVRGDQTIAPGNYGDVTVADRGVARFQSGIYYFRRLVVRNGGRVDVASTAGPLFMNVLLHFSSSGQWQGNASDVFVSSFAADPVLLGSGAIGTIVAPKTTIKLLRKDDGRREHGFWKNHRWWDRARRDDRDHHDDRVHDDRVHDDRDHDGRDHGDRDHDDDNGGYDWKSGDSNSKHGQGRNSANDVDFRGTLFAKHVVLSAQTRLVVEPFRSWPKVVSQGMDLGRPVPPSPANPRVLHRPPPLMATGAGATVQVREFIRWAAGAVPDEDEDIRQSVAGSRFNADIVHAFAAEVDASLAADWSRSLVAITLLGSMRAPSAEDYLTAFVRLPLPTTGTVGGHPFSSGTPVEAMTLTMLQAAAVDGLALIQTGSSKAEVRRLAREHPAASVRVESVRAYITNYGEAGREELRAILPPNERIAVDFFENRDRAGSTFDSRLQTFLSQHPEANNTVGD